MVKEMHLFWDGLSMNFIKKNPRATVPESLEIKYSPQIGSPALFLNGPSITKCTNHTEILATILFVV